MWSYSKQRQPWQLQKRLQTMLPAASLRHLSGCLPGTVSAFAQQRPFAFESKNLGLSSILLLLPPRERCGEEEEEEELILALTLSHSLSPIWLERERQRNSMRVRQQKVTDCSSDCPNRPTRQLCSLRSTALYEVEQWQAWAFFGVHVLFIWKEFSSDIIRINSFNSTFKNV